MKLVNELWRYKYAKLAFQNTGWNLLGKLKVLPSPMCLFGKIIVLSEIIVHAKLSRLSKRKKGFKKQL
jgi:hypothetical protein